MTPPGFDVHAILKRIRASRSSELNQLHQLDKPLERVLWILTSAADAGYLLPLTSVEIRTLLEEFGVAAINVQIAKALSRANDLVIKGHADGRNGYRISQKGRERLRAILQPEGTEVLYIEPGHRFSARKGLVDLVSPLRGALSIADRLYSARTFDVLASIAQRPGAIRFLTERPGGGEKENALRLLAGELTAEHQNLEIKRVDRRDQLHDRYILSDHEMLLIGAGIKDPGSRESFVVLLTESTSKDTLQLLQRNFDDRWTRAVPL
jgi:hypothetical protein